MVFVLEACYLEKKFLSRLVRCCRVDVTNSFLSSSCIVVSAYLTPVNSTLLMLNRRFIYILAGSREQLQFWVRLHPATHTDNSDKTWTECTEQLLENSEKKTVGRAEKKTMVHNTTKPVASLPVLPLCYPLAWTQYSLTWKQKWALGHKKSTRRSPPVVTQRTENGVSMIECEDLFLFFFIPLDTRFWTPMMVAVACRSQNSKEGEPSPLIGGVVLLGG